MTRADSRVCLRAVIVSTISQRTDEALEALIMKERRRQHTWGPKKLRRILETKHSIENPPACSTPAEILRRHGLSVRRRRRPGAFLALNHGLTEPTQPNQVWTVDFKGWFNLKKWPTLKWRRDARTCASSDTAASHLRGTASLQR
jgi:hypothetical protein